MIRINFLMFTFPRIFSYLCIKDNYRILVERHSSPLKRKLTREFEYCIRTHKTKPIGNTGVEG